MKKMKTKIRKKKTTKKRVQTPKVPKELKPFVVRKFRTKDRTKRVVVVRLTKDSGYNVQTISQNGVQVIWDFSLPGSLNSDIPTPILLPVQRLLATWWAGIVARTGTPPSQKKERSRRRRFTKRLLAAHQKDLQTKAVVDKLYNKPGPAKRKKPQMILPFICMYNPMAKKKDPVFVVHTAYCPRLDQERKRMLKRGGTSWVIESKTPEEAVGLQLAEFIEEDKGYDREDFHIHDCKGGAR